MAVVTPDYVYPMMASIYYPIVEQGSYGNVKKQWILDRVALVNLAAKGGAMNEDVKPNVNITQDFVLVGRTKTDIRVSSKQAKTSITNVIVSNVCDRNGNSIYNETSGSRAGKATIFEIAGQEPFIGPFGDTEYYKILLRRSENQAVDL
tara:strand:+ start:9307 stop:9753 length:447 start_codon:yes stop_codon:yes gene_type:complete